MKKLEELEKEVTSTKELKELEKEGYVGSDCSLEISLFEYGIAWKEEKEQITFIYGIAVDNESYFNKFDFCCFDKNIKILDEFSWIDTSDILKFFGYDSFEKFENRPLGIVISDLVSYYDYENIFGSSYSYFEITMR